MEPTIIGIDVSKDRLDVHVRPSGESFTVAHNAAGLDQLVERLRALAPQLVALEATGGFEAIATAALAAAGLPVVVTNPAQTRAFASALGQRAKTDPIDAGVIARFAEATRPTPRPLPDEATRTPRITVSFGAAGGQAIDATVASNVDVSVRFGPERLAGVFHPAWAVRRARFSPRSRPAGACCR